MTEQFNHEFGRRARQNNGRTSQGEIDFHDHGANAIAIAKVFFGNHFAATQAAFNTARLDNDVALVHALDGTHQNLLAPCHELIEQHFALGISNLLQDDLFGRHGANSANGQ